MKKLLNKQTFKNVLDKLKTLKFLVVLLQEMLYLIFNLVYGFKPLLKF